jgi:DNA repair protein RadA/Sms
VPYKVGFLGLGNESWGCGGAMSADHYVEQMKQFSRYTRNYNPAQQTPATAMKRIAVGWDSGRLAMILAVLEARCGLSFASSEVYLNVAGGYRLSDPAADLAVAAALVSALSERPVPSESVVLGEIALSGEVRPVAHAGLRLKEAAKLGFEIGWVPKGIKAGEGTRLSEFASLRQLVDQLLGR